MKTPKLHLFEQGRKIFEETNEFKAKAEGIRMEVVRKYSVLINEENSSFKQWLLRLNMDFEIRKRIREISSRGNLHVMKTSRL